MLRSVVCISIGNWSGPYWLWYTSSINTGTWYTLDRDTH